MNTSKFGVDLTQENLAKLVEERFTTTEDTMAKLCASFSLFTKRTAKYRDANDQIANILNDYAGKEQINTTLKVGMENMAKSLAVLGDHRDNSTQYLEEQVMSSLTQYAARCKNFNSEIKNIYSAKEKELSKKRQLTKIRQRLPHNVKVIAKAQGDLVEACSRVSKLQGSLEEYALSFERNKLNDLKRIFSDFIKAELSFHIGAIQALSNALVEIENVNIDVDYHAFKTVLIRPNVALRLDIVRGSKAYKEEANTGIPVVLDSHVAEGRHYEEQSSKVVSTEALDVTSSAVGRDYSSEVDSSDAEEDLLDDELASTIQSTATKT